MPDGEVLGEVPSVPEGSSVAEAVLALMRNEAAACGVAVVQASDGALLGFLPATALLEESDKL